MARRPPGARKHMQNIPVNEDFQINSENSKRQLDN